MPNPLDRRGIPRREFLDVGLAVLAGVVGGRAALGGASSRPTRLRVLCYNIHHGRGTDGRVDLPRLARVIRAAEPDLVALQEVDRKTRRTGGVDQTAELARLTGLKGRFGKGRDYDGGEYGQAILSRFPLGEAKVHKLSETQPRDERIAVEVPVKVGEREISFVSTHLHHLSREFRKQQAAKLNELFGGEERPVILAGDLNATPDSPPLKTLSKKWTVAGSGRPLLTFPSAKPVKQIDYILFRPETRFREVSIEVIDEAVASDHRPLLAVLELR